MSSDEAISDRLRAALATSGGAAGVTPACPDASRIWAAIAGKLAAEQAHDLVDHAATCPACALAWRLGREVAAAAAETKNGTETSPRLGVVVPMRRRWAWVAAAAAAVIMVAAAVPLLLERRGPPSEFRGEPLVAIVPLMEDGRAVSRDDCLLAWSPGPAGTRYSVWVATAGLDPIASAVGLDVSRYRVTAAALARVRPGETIVWRVEALLPDGGRITTRSLLLKIK